MTETTIHPNPAHLTPAHLSPVTEITIEAAIARFGAARVLAVALRELLRGRGARQDPALTAVVNEHIRRDIGLAPRQAAPPLDVLTRHLW